MAPRDVAVLQLSDAFSSLWPELAAGIDAQLRVLDGARPMPGSADAVATVLAAGGMEREAADWLDRFGVPAGATLFVVGADPERRTGMQMIIKGATDYFALPEDLEILRNAVAGAAVRFDARARSASRHAGGAKAEAFRALVGESPALRKVLRQAERILPHADATALIMGETGTGKELLARAIHEGGPRRASPFVAVNCSALPERLIESELFGHERGAFTDAHAAKPGLFEMAEGGTLFLDEVGSLPVDLQAKLLRVLEDREIRRVGGTKSRRVDIRIVAATNSDLEQDVAAGSFREDLYFRLSVIVLRLPPLRERGEDVLLIASALMRRLASQYHLPVPPLSPAASRALQGFRWPGNVRQLKNTIERALLLSPPGELDLVELTESPRSRAAGAAAGSPAVGALPLSGTLDDMTSAAAQETLRLCGGNLSQAARQLGVSRQRLRRLLRASSDVWQPNGHIRDSTQGVLP